jgi:hypothetical protein
MHLKFAKSADITPILNTVIQDEDQKRAEFNADFILVVKVVDPLFETTLMILKSAEDYAFFGTRIEYFEEFFFKVISILEKHIRKKEYFQKVC